MHARFRWTCPHCGMEQNGLMEDICQNKVNIKFIYCDLEEGGCDEMSAVQVIPRMEVHVMKLVSVNDE